MFLVLAVIICVDTLGRKFFSFSLQGTDELSGYFQAAGAAITATCALVGASHMRIDILFQHLGRKARALVNWLASITMGAMASLLGWSAWNVLMETLEYGSTAATPWATPLQYPQGVWALGFVLFGLVAAWYAVKSTALLLKGDTGGLIREFSPKSSQKELEEEIAETKRRLKEGA